ncbi:hypothetical protein QN239_27470 [Mycolicibacterium sp. Y3]
MTQPTGINCDLLAEVATPDGVTAGPWHADASGHLIRTLSDGRTQRGNGDIITQCKHCTVPADAGGADACAFCADYTPPAGDAMHQIVTVDKDTPWREVADELTDHQRQQIEYAEQQYREAGTLDDPRAQRSLLEFTLNYVNGNRIDAAYADVPLPEGATIAPGDGWSASFAEPQTYSRPVTWRQFVTGVADVSVEISGRQSTDGTFTRRIEMYAEDNIPLDEEGARRLAAALTEAAEALARITESAR